MVNDLLDRGLPATDLVVGTEVAAFIQSDENTLKLLDNRRASMAAWRPRCVTPAWCGSAT